MNNEKIPLIMRKQYVISIITKKQSPFNVSCRGGYYVSYKIGNINV